jgi:folate-binding protein YgfZ
MAMPPQTKAAPELESEYRLLREDVGMVDRELGVIAIAGPDAVEFLQGQITNDVDALQEGDGCYALLLSPKGRILAEMRVLMRSPQELWLLTEQDEAVLAHLTTYKIGRQVEVGRRSAAVKSLIGPRARAVAGVAAPLDENESTDATLADVDVLVVATDLGVDVVHELAHAEALGRELEARGVELVDEQSAEVLRIEGGRPRYGSDMTADNLPGELGLEARAVSFTKGCYIGQEPVARMHHKGHPNRHLRGVELREPAAPGASIHVGDKEVGAITSSCVSPRRGAIALALVRREVEPGAELAVGNARLGSRLVELPFERDG